MLRKVFEPLQRTFTDSKRNDRPIADGPENGTRYVFQAEFFGYRVRDGLHSGNRGPFSDKIVSEQGFWIGIVRGFDRSSDATSAVGS